MNNIINYELLHNYYYNYELLWIDNNLILQKSVVNIEACYAYFIYNSMIVIYEWGNHMKSYYEKATGFSKSFVLCFLMNISIFISCISKYLRDKSWLWMRKNVI